MDTVANPDLRIGHDIKHVERVRHNALTIARAEGFADLDLVEAAALLHDIGLAHVETRERHGPVGAREWVPQASLNDRPEQDDA